MSDAPNTPPPPSAAVPEPGKLGDQIGAYVGFWVSLLTLGVGIVLGNIAAGAKTTIDGYGGETLTSFTTGTSGDGGFNWLVFSIFAAAALLCFTIGFCVASITRNMPTVRTDAPPTDPGYAA